MTGFARNRIYRYGSNLPYSGPIKSKKLPDWIAFVIDRLLTQNLLTERPDHLTINEYHKGQSIDWHIDSKTSGDIISVLSLESDAVMDIRKDKSFGTMQLPPRSLIQMTGEHRWDWAHSIQPLKGHRWSLVFRKGTKL